MPGPIEFLPEEPARPDADDAPAPGPVGRPRRGVHLVRAALVLAVVAGAAVWVATQPSAPGRPHVVATVTAAAPMSTAAPGPTVVTCRLGAPVETDIARAMRFYLPGLVVDNLRAYRCTSGAGEASRVVSETLDGRFRTIHIRLEVAARGADQVPDLGVEPDASSADTTLGSVEAVSVGLTVRAVATGHRGSRAPLERMRELADYISLNILL